MNFNPVYVFAGWCFFGITALAFQEEKPSDNSPPPSPKIMEMKTETEIDLSQLVSDLMKHEVVFLGEVHDNDAGHEFQLKVIQALIDGGAQLAISMEQFERDTQGAVDDYLAGRIDEDKFMNSSRPWPNYQKHYKAIIELAKEKQLPVIAANVPRKVASDMSGNQTIKLSDKVFLPRTTTAPEDQYWQNFLETMKGHVGADGTEQLKSFYAAQCLKDDAMAEAITDYEAKNRHRPQIVVHLCGHFHSDYGLGTVARVQQRSPLARIAVVTMETIPDDGKMEVAKCRDRAHYIFWTVKNPPKTETPPE